MGLTVTGNGAEGFGDLAEQTKEKGLCLRQSGCTKSFGMVQKCLELHLRKMNVVAG